MMNVGDNVKLIITGNHWLVELIGKTEVNAVVIRQFDCIYEIAINESQKYVIDMDDDMLDWIIIRDNQDQLRDYSHRKYVRIKLVNQQKEQPAIHVDTGEDIMIVNPYWKQEKK